MVILLQINIEALELVTLLINVNSVLWNRVSCLFPEKTPRVLSYLYKDKVQIYMNKIERDTVPSLSQNKTETLSFNTVILSLLSHINKKKNQSKEF